MYNGSVKANIVKRTILIVEDNEINRDLLKEVLGGQYNIIEASNGIEGLNQLKNHLRELSLILLDVHMPIMDGYAFLEEYRKDEFLSSVPVIVMTGSKLSGDEERCLAMGASDFVTKPYNPKVIIRRVEAIIRLHESIATLQDVEFDSLTGLYTQNAFIHYAQNFIDKNKDADFDMMMINIEDFSYINEMYGEAKGDELLKHIGNCISTVTNDTTLTCRYVADRFLFLSKHFEHSSESKNFDFEAYMHNNAPIDNFRVKCAIYYNIDKNVTIGVLCDRMSRAMKTIKGQYNKRIAYYDSEMTERLKRLKRIEKCMEQAIDEGQFKIYYQPKHDIKTGKLSGAEAFARWIHPEYGFLSPGEFIPLFEENGFITKLDLYIWETVCKNLKLWQDNNITPVPISVNASRRDFVTIPDIKTIMQPISDYSLDKELLHIEVTESLEIDDKIVLRKVREIRNEGIKIELDDFGSGHSSLSTLTDIPMDIIKLDAGFIRGLNKQKTVVKMIISLAHALNCKIVAEGVETKEQIDILNNFDCDYVQGYYYSRPIPEEEFREYLKKCD